MKKFISTIVLSSLITAAWATPALAGKFKLSEYKTVAVAPVLSASNTRGQFEATLAAVASGYTYDKAGAPVIQKASGKALDTKGFGFAGKAQGGDIALLTLSSTLAMLPTMMQMDAAQAKTNATQLAQYVAKIEGKVAPDVTKAINLALAAVQADDFQTAMKALLVAMAVSADSISKGSERPHGYIAVGIYSGLATAFAAAGQKNQALAEIAAPLIVYLEQDAVLGGADRKIAVQLTIVGKELMNDKPSLETIINAISAMQAVKPD